MVIINVYKRIDMKRYILLVIAFALGIGGYAQEKSENISGIVVDKFGNPVSGALIELRNSPDTKTYTDQQGKFSILADKDAQLFVDAPDQSEKTISLTGSKNIRIVMDYASRPVNIGFGIRQNVEESTMSVASH